MVGYKRYMIIYFEEYKIGKETIYYNSNKIHP